MIFGYECLMQGEADAILRDGLGNRAPAYPLPSRPDESDCRQFFLHLLCELFGTRNFYIQNCGIKTALRHLPRFKS